MLQQHTASPQYQARNSLCRCNSETREFTMGQGAGVRTWQATSEMVSSQGGRQLQLHLLVRVEGDADGASNSLDVVDGRRPDLRMI